MKVKQLALHSLVAANLGVDAILHSPVSAKLGSCLISFLLLGMNVPQATAHAEDESFPLDKQDDANKALKPPTASLRGLIKEAVQNETAFDSKALADTLLEKPIHTLSIEERKDLVEDLGLSLEDLILEYQRRQESNEQFPDLQIDSRFREIDAEKVNQLVSELVDLLDEADDTEDVSSTDVIVHSDDRAERSRHRQRRRVSKNQDSDGFKMNNSQSKIPHNHMDRMLRNSYGVHGSGFHNQRFLHSQMPSWGGGRFESTGPRRTKWSGNGRRLSTHNKDVQCQLLAECAGAMSAYDFFVYAFSDDISPETGEIDGVTVMFDEADVVRKHSDINTMAVDVQEMYVEGKSVLTAEDLDVKCNILLEQFHRNIEKGDVPEWQGAIVSQVCLAEGSTVYVKIDHLMDTVLKDVLLDDLWIENEAKAESIIGETFRCAEELFYSNDREINHSSEEFIFVGCEGSSTQSCGLDNYKIPVAVDKSFLQPVYYGETLFIQSNDRDSEWLEASGGKDKLRANLEDYFRQNIRDRDGFRWQIWSIRDDSNDPKVGSCVKYGETVYFGMKSDEYWTYLSLKDKGQVDSVATSFDDTKYSSEWKIRSSVTGSITASEVDPKEGECITLDSKIWIQSLQEFEDFENNSNDEKGKKDEKNKKDNETLFLRGDNRVDVRDWILSNSLQWILRKEAEESGSREITAAISRDKHGHVLEGKSGFVMKSFDQLVNDSKRCKRKIDREDAEDPELTLAEFHEKYRGCLAKHTNGPIGHGLELVFGANSSPGFLCGVKEAVVNHRRSLPGYCCLDAPFELGGDNWGHQFDCQSTCNKYGPYFSGLSEASCKAHGGTFCPNEADCTVLATCVDELKTEAVTEGLAFFKQYLDTAPNLTDAHDFRQCGKVRNYFGFDEFFIHDGSICEDVEQLKYSKNFDFLAEFFDLGSDDGGSGGDGDEKVPVKPKEVAKFVLPEIDRELSKSKAVKGGTAWSSVNFALQQVLNLFQGVHDVISDFECPEDLTGAVKSACAGIKNFGLSIVQLVLVVCQLIVDISEFTYGQKAQLNDPSNAEIYENTDAIYDHMIESGKWMENSFNLVLEEIAAARNDALGRDRHLALLAGASNQNEAEMLSSPSWSESIKSKVGGTEKSNFVHAEVDRNDEIITERLDGLDASLGNLDEKIDNRVEGLEMGLANLVTLVESLISTTTASTTEESHEKVLYEAKFIEDRLNNLEKIKHMITEEEYQDRRTLILSDL